LNRRPDVKHWRKEYFEGDSYEHHWVVARKLDLKKILMKVVGAFSTHPKTVRAVINDNEWFASFGIEKTKAFINSLVEETDLIPVKVTNFVRRIEERHGRLQYSLENGATKSDHIRIAKCTTDMALMGANTPFTLIPGSEGEDSTEMKEKFYWTYLHELTHWVHRTEDNKVKKTEATLSGAMEKGKWLKKVDSPIKLDLNNADSWTQLIFKLYLKTQTKRN